MITFSMNSCFVMGVDAADLKSRQQNYGLFFASDFPLETFVLRFLRVPSPIAIAPRMSLNPPEIGGIIFGLRLMQSKTLLRQLVGVGNTANHIRENLGHFPFLPIQAE